MRLLWANLRKLRRRPATWVTFVLVVVLNTLITMLVVFATRQADDPQTALASRVFLTFPNAYELILQMVLGIGGLIAVCYGAAIAGSEWGWGTLKAAVARGESRTRYTLAGFGGVAVYTLLGLAGAFLAGVAVSVAGALLTGVSLSGMTDFEGMTGLPELFARSWLSLAMNAGIGFAIATIARSQLAGIGVSIGLFFGGGIAGIFAPHIVKWLPFEASGAVVSGGSGGGMMVGGTEIGVQLDSTTAIVVTVAWLVLAMAAASIFTERAEISG
ncbi:MAG: ABC transporter permease subunit [Chloroflexota bacterium]